MAGRRDMGRNKRGKEILVWENRQKGSKRSRRRMKGKRSKNEDTKEHEASNIDPTAEKFCMLHTQN
jgi:hypothetical protein